MLLQIRESKAHSQATVSQHVSPAKSTAQTSPKQPTKGQETSKTPSPTASAEKVVAGTHELVTVPTLSEKVSTPENVFAPLESELESLLQKNPVLHVGDSMSHSRKRKVPESKLHEVIHIAPEEEYSDDEIQGFSGEEEGDEEEEEIQEKPLASRRALPKRQPKIKEEPKSKPVRAPPQKKPRASKGKAKMKKLRASRNEEFWSHSYVMKLHLRYFAQILIFQKLLTNLVCKDGLSSKLNRQVLT